MVGIPKLGLARHRPFVLRTLNASGDMRLNIGTHGWPEITFTSRSDRASVQGDLQSRCHELDVRRLEHNTLG